MDVSQRAGRCMAFLDAPVLIDIINQRLGCVATTVSAFLAPVTEPVDAHGLRKPEIDNQ